MVTGQKWPGLLPAFPRAGLTGSSISSNRNRAAAGKIVTRIERFFVRDMIENGLALRLDAVAKRDGVWRMWSPIGWMVGECCEVSDRKRVLKF